MATVEDLAESIASIDNLFIITGAGISVASGISHFAELIQMRYGIRMLRKKEHLHIFVQMFWGLGVGIGTRFSSYLENNPILHIMQQQT